MILLVAVLAGVFFAMGIHETAANHAISASGSATVIKSWNTDPTDTQIEAIVLFRTRSGRFVKRTIWPGGLNPLTRWQDVPIRYDPANPRHLYYAGPYGDAKSPDPNAPYFIGTFLAIAAGALLIIYAPRVIGIMRAAATDVTTSVQLTMSGEIVRTGQLHDGYSLTWLVLERQPHTAGDVPICGKPEGGRWLVMRRTDGRLVWPASQAEPVLESAEPRLPTVEHGPIGAVHLLLASYTRIIDLLGALPLVIRLQPRSSPDGLWVGALRPVVKTLVNFHLRRRLAALSNAMLRAALLCDDKPYSHRRRMLTDASDECRALARTLPRRGFLLVLATLATITATSMTIVSPFLVLPRIRLNGHVVSHHVLLIVIGVVICVLIFGVLAPLIFFESARYKRALFNPATANSGRRVTEAAASLNTELDVYRLECEAFAKLEAPEPNEWESRQQTRWLTVALYLAAIAIPFAYAYTLPTLTVLGISAALFALVMLWKWQRRVRTLHASPDQPEPSEDTPPQTVDPV